MANAAVSLSRGGYFNESHKPDLQSLTPEVVNVYLECEGEIECLHCGWIISKLWAQFQNSDSVQSSGSVFRVEPHSFLLLSNTEILLKQSRNRLNGAVFHSAEPTVSEAWLVPAEKSMHLHVTTTSTVAEPRRTQDGKWRQLLNRFGSLDKSCAPESQSQHYQEHMNYSLVDLNCCTIL